MTAAVPLARGHAQLVKPAGPAGAAQGQSVPLIMRGAFGINVQLALEANGGALKQVRIAPGERWSFNVAVGDPGQISGLQTIMGVYGGGWCDLASRYVQAARPLGPQVQLLFPEHRRMTGFGLHNVADEDAVAIWNTNSGPGGQDLEIVNHGSRPLWFAAVIEGEVLIIQAGWE